MTWDGKDRRKRSAPVLLDHRRSNGLPDTGPQRRIAALGTAMKRLTPFLYRESVTDIILNPDGKLWVDDGGLHYTDMKFDPHEGETIIRMIASATGQECNAENPILSAEIPYLRYRFEGNLPPVVEAPSFCIRKPATIIYTLDQYVGAGIMSEHQAAVIREAIRSRENLLIVGGTGSGKTTLANAILAEIAKTGHRVILLEDTRELQCAAENVTSLRTVNDRKNPVTMIDLLRTCMRQYPDRIVVGEVRGGEAHALLKAWNTGHPGGCATVHADSARGGLVRLEQLILEAVEVPQQTLIGEAVGLIIYIKKQDGKRMVGEIFRCQGFCNEGTYKLKEM